MKVPFAQPGEWPEVPPSRYAAGIARSDPDGCAVALVGLPDDLGVRLNRGRPGAAQGPTAFRRALAGYGCGFDLVQGEPIRVRVFDAGDIAPAPGVDEGALRETHRRVTEAVLAVHRAGMVAACIGGGHDLTFPAVRALAEHAGGAVGGVNIDPHLDVRESAGSGMPFRALIEGGHTDAGRFGVLGAGRFVNAAEHEAWLRGRGGLIVPIGALAAGAAGVLGGALDRAAGPCGGASFVSFDLDSLDSSSAPGVSAPNPEGLSVREAAALCVVAGADARVRHFDLMELCPAHDEQGRTARAAAHLFMCFLAGFAERPR